MIMTNQIKVTFGFIMIALIAGLLIFYHPKTITQPTTKTNPALKVISPQVHQMGSAVSVKVDKIDGQEISFTWFGKPEVVTVTATTTITKQVNTNGKFSDVVIKLSDIKPGQFIEVMFSSSPQIAKSVKLLE